MHRSSCTPVVTGLADVGTFTATVCVREQCDHSIHVHLTGFGDLEAMKVP